LLPIVRKIAVGAAGGVVVMAGVALIVLPGPAIVVIPIGLSILAREFDWAKRLLGHARGFGARSLKRMAALRPRRHAH
jgi:tellurite resistance protein TerC